MKTIRTAIIGLMLMIAFVVTGELPASADANASWSEYSYAADGFAVSAPQRPTVKKLVTQTAAGPVTSQVYSVDLGGNNAFMFSSTHYDQGLIAPRAMDALEGAKNGAVANVHGTLVSQQRISIDGNPGYELFIAASNYHVRVRIYVVGDYLYQLLAIAPVDAPLPKDSDKFLGSFRLLGKP